jgi:L-cysteine/cystine lyase
MREQLELEALDRQPVDLWRSVERRQLAARAAAARLTNVAPRQVALMHSTHEGVNAALWGLELRPGDNVLISDEEHPGVLIPARIQCERRGAALRRVTWSADPEQLTDSVRAASDTRTRALVMAHVSWLSGRVAPVRALRAVLPERAVLILDGAQAAGAMPVEVGEGAADAYTVSGQKWPLGPNGCGALVLADPERWHPTFGGFFATEDPQRALEAPWQPDGRRLEHSQEDQVALAGFAAGAGFLLDEVGVEAAAARSRGLNMLARELLAEPMELLGGGTMSGDVHLLALRLTQPRAAQAAGEMSKAGVSVRAIDAHVLRLSLGFWNDGRDLERARDATLAFASRPR